MVVLNIANFEIVLGVYKFKVNEIKRMSIEGWK